MKFIFDSREKDNGHIKRWFDRKGLEYEVRKLDVGDYMMEGKPGLVIDRKKSLDELATNLLNRSDRARFWREVRRAREQGIRLIVLCEHGHGIQNIHAVKNWKSDYSRVTGHSLMNEMFRVHISYGVEFLFTDRRHMAKRILELLTEETTCETLTESLTR